MHEFFSFNFPLREYFFWSSPAPLPYKFSNGPSLNNYFTRARWKWDGERRNEDPPNGELARRLRGASHWGGYNAWFSLTCCHAPGSSHWGFAIVVHSPPSCTQKETILRPRAPDRPHIRFLRVHPFECNSDFRTMAKRDVFRTFIKVSRVHWERDNTWWLTHEQYIRKREGR